MRADKSDARCVVRPHNGSVDVCELCRPNGDFLALIDSVDADDIRQFRWYRGKNGYVVRSYMRGKYQQTVELLQRRIAHNAGLPVGRGAVRFNDSDRTNCRRENLTVTHFVHRKTDDDSPENCDTPSHC